MPRKKVNLKAKRTEETKGKFSLPLPKKKKLQKLPLTFSILFRAFTASLANLEEKKYDKQFFSFSEHLIDHVERFLKRQNKEAIPFYEELLTSRLIDFFEKSKSTSTVFDQKTLTKLKKEVSEILVETHVPEPLDEKKINLILAHLSPEFNDQTSDQFVGGGIKEKSMVLAGILFDRKRDIRSKHSQKKRVQSNRSQSLNFSLSTRYDEDYLSAKYKLLLSLDIPKAAMVLIMKDDSEKAKSPDARHRTFVRAYFRSKDEA